jgi:acyl-CoA synthetase (AMP-forming)/AMP-acid ligase II
MLDGLFDAAARAHPSSIAIVDGEQRITYSELARRRDRIASLLSGIGVGSGDRIGVSLPNSWEYAASFLAAASIRADWVPFYPAWRSSEAEWLAGRLPLGVLVTTTSLAGAWKSVSGVRPERIVLVDDPDISLFADEGNLPAVRSERDPVVNYTTSGSTGSPRIAPRRHSQIASAVNATAAALGVRECGGWQRYRSTMDTV